MVRQAAAGDPLLPSFLHRLGAPKQQPRSPTLTLLGLPGPRHPTPSQVSVNPPWELLTHFPFSSPHSKLTPGSSHSIPISSLDSEKRKAGRAGLPPSSDLAPAQAGQWL